MTAIVSGRRIEGKRVVLADRGYERCTFVGCELVFDGRPVHLVDNSFTHCSWAFDGPAGVTLGFLQALCQSDPDLRASIARQLGIEAPSGEPFRPSAPVPQSRAVH